jgi:hypothetical protein
MGAEQSAPDAAERLLQGAADWLSICRLGSIDSQMPRLVLLHMRAYASASIVEAHMTKMNIAAAASRLNVSVDSVRRRLRSGAIDGARDERGQWWLELPDNIPPEPNVLSVDQKLVLGMAMPAQGPASSQDGLIETLQDRIDDLLSRLDSAEKERREDKAKAAAERDRFLTLIENLTRPAARA